VKTSVAEASKNKEAMLRELARRVEGRKEEIQEQASHLTALVVEDFDRIIKAAEARRQHLIEALQQVAKEKEEALTAQHTSLLAESEELAEGRKNAVAAVECLDARQYPM